VSKRNNTSSSRGQSTAAPHEGWREGEAERLARGKPLYLAQVLRESRRWNGSAWEADPEGNGEHAEYEERFFIGLADAERWVGWQLAQWPAVVIDNGDVLDATAELQRVAFPPRDPAWPREAMHWEHHPGFESRMYGEPVAPELDELALRLAQTAGPHGSSA
jgi:hypothetical protein